MFLAWIAGCTDAPPPPASDSATGTPEVRFTTPPLSVGPGKTQHHATLGLRPDGVAVVAWRSADRAEAATVHADGRVTALALPEPAAVNHPQVRATATGYLAVATADGALGLVGTSIGAGGGDVAEATVLAAGAAYLPDLDVRGDEGVVLWTDLEALHCRGFTGGFEDLSEVDCPTRVGADSVVGGVTVRLGDDRAHYAWAEQHPDGAVTIHTAPPEVLVATVRGGALAARPALAVDRDGGALAVAWVGADSDDAPLRTVVQGFEPDGDALGEPQVVASGAGAYSVVLGGPVDGVLVAAFEEGGQLWLQLRDAVAAAPLGEPVRVADPGDGEPRRPYVDLVRADGGGILGLVSWEAVPPEVPVTAFDQGVVRVRAFAVEWAPAGGGS